MVIYTKAIHNSSRTGNCSNRLTKMALLLITIFLPTLFATSVYSQQPAANLDQIRNGAADDRVSPGAWSNGNLNQEQAHYLEGYSVAYRAILTNLPTGVPITITLGFDIKHSDRHALDYLTHYNRLESHAQFLHAAEEIDPTDDVTGTFIAGADFPIPPPSSTGSPVAGQPTTSFNNLSAAEKGMSIWNGTISNIVYSTNGDLTDDQSESRVDVTFTANSPTVILAWGGHIAARADWGFDANDEPLSAGGIDGSPYHMRLIGWTLTNLGNQDRSLAAAAVLVCEVDPGEINNAQTICSGEDPAALTSVEPGDGSGDVTYQWIRSTTSCETGFTDIPGATEATFDPGPLTVTTYYKRVTINTTTPLVCRDTSNCVAVTVNDITAGEINNAQTICSGEDPAALSSVSAATGSGTLSYQWLSSTTSCAAGFSQITGATEATFDPGPLTVTTYYRRIATSTLNSVPCADTSNCVAITVNDVDAGEINNAQTICGGEDPAALTSVSEGSGSGTLSYQWLRSTTSCAAGFTEIEDATSATFDPGPLTVTTFYRRVTISTLNEVPCADTSNCVEITVGGVDPGEINNAQTICSGEDPAALTSVEAATGPGTITYQWQSNTTGCEAEFTNIEGATEATFDPGPLTVTTYYRRVATATLNGVPCIASSNCVAVTVNDITAGEINNAQTICSGEDPAALSSVSAATGSGTITYQWLSSTTSCAAGFSQITGATEATFDPGPLTVTTYYRRIATSTLNSVPCADTSNCVAITVNDVDAGEINNAQTICSGTDAETLSSVTDGTGSGNVTYQWISSSTSCDAGFTEIEGANAATFDPGILTQTTYYRRITISTLNEVPCADTSNCVVVTVIDCALTLCSYTQGAYGNEGGKYCTPDGKKTTVGLITLALDSWPNDMIVIGRSGRSFTIRKTTADINAVIDLLPGGGPSAILPAGDFFASSTLPSSLLKNGRLKNTLLAQTITFGLNLGGTTSLQDFELKANLLLVTAKPAESCNTSSGEFVSCTYKTATLPSANVIQYLFDNIWNGTAFVPDVSANKKATAYELFQLASAALGNAGPAGISLESISSLEDKLNNVFDGCRVVIGYMTAEEFAALNAPCTVTLTTNEARGTATGAVKELTLSAYPNPYRHTIHFNFVSPVSGRALLEVYDLMGRKIANVYQGYVDAGIQKSVNYTVPALQRMPMIYRLSIGNKTSFGKLLPDNGN